MAALDASRYKLIIEALRFKLKNRTNPLLTQYKGWLYEGKGGIFWVARHNFPQFYQRQFPTETSESNSNYAALLINNLDKHLDPTLLDYFKDETAPSLDEKTGQIIDRAVKIPTLVGAVSEHGASKGAVIHPPHIVQAPVEKPKQKQVPEAFQKAFENEPEFKTNPDIKPPQIPQGVTNAAKNASSLAQRSFYRNIGSKINLNSAVNGLGKLLGGITGGVGGSVGGGIAGGLRASTPFFSRAGKGMADLGVRFTDATSGLNGGQSLIKSKKKIWLLVGCSFAFFVLNLFSAIQSQTPSAEASPAGLNYTLPLKNPDITPVDIRDQIKLAFPQSKLEYWDTIINTTKAVGLNPALALALWIEETGASQTTVVRNGGSGIPTSAGNLTVGHLGCAPTEDQTITESLSCLIKFINNNNFTNDQFPIFMAKYSGGPAGNPFSNNPNFPVNFKNWYSKLAPVGIGAIQIITSLTAYTPNGGSGIVSCPLNGATTITLGSKDAGGHCTPKYQAQEALCLPGDPTGRATAIDAQSLDKAIFLPLLGGSSADWTVDTTSAINDGGVYVGQDLAATALYNGRTYRIRFVHLDSTQLKIGSHYPSGTLVGVYRPAQNHVHITLQEDGTFKPADLYFNLCR